MSESKIKHCEKHGDVIFHKWQNRWRCSKCAAEAVQKRRDILKIKAVEYKGGKCEVCGYNKNYAVLEFHHLDPSQKDFGIGQNGYTRSWEETKVELDKCIMVCANCHRELHYPEWNRDNIENRLNSYKKKEKLEIPEKQDLENKINSGKSKTEIAKEYNVSCNTLNKWLQIYSIIQSKPIRPSKEEIVEKLKTQSAYQLSKYYGMSDRGFYKLCQRLNIDYKKK